MSRIPVVLLLMAIAPVACRARKPRRRLTMRAAAPAGDQAADETPAADAGAATPPADAAPAASPEATAANEAFEALVDQWNTADRGPRKLQQQRDAAEGQARADFEIKMADKRRETAALVDKIADAGLAVYKLDPVSFPRVNGTLLTIAKFHVIGDAYGDGGDQYEKALPLAEGLIAAGAGEKFPQLYLFAGASAFNVGELEQGRAIPEESRSRGDVR